MISLHLRLAPPPWEALQVRRRASGQSVGEIVGAALAEHLQLDQTMLCAERTVELASIADVASLESAIAALAKAEK